MLNKVNSSPYFMLIILFTGCGIIISLPLTKLKKMRGLKIGNLEVAVPIVQGGMGVGISLSGLPMKGG